MAKEAGYVTFQGLPGKVITGCPLTPELRSRYCHLHKPRVCTKLLDDANMTDGEEDIIEMILEERVTRSATLYKVTWYLCTYILCKLWWTNSRYCG